MDGKRIIIFNITYLMVVSEILIRAEKSVDSLRDLDDERRFLEIFPGVKMLVQNNEVKIKFVPQNEIQGSNDVKAKAKDDDKESGLSKFGTMMTILPLIFQMFSLPAALASIKMSLLKSLLVGKLALAIMIYNAIRNSQNTKEVVVHQIHQQHIDYYPNQYYNIDENDDDDDNDDNNGGWFGRRKRR